MTLQEKYLEKCNTRSDIHELLPILEQYASRSKTCTELGTRFFVSTYALLEGCDYVTAVDIEPQEMEYEECKRLANAAGKTLNYIIKSSLEIDLEPTDMLFIDTWHNGNQLRKELKRHHSKVGKFIAMHDTTTYWDIGETPYDKIEESGQFSGEGIGKAIEEFLEEHPEWKIDLKLENNNGLTILAKSNLE